MSWLAHAGDEAQARIEVIADELGLEYRRTIRGIELRRMAREHGADLEDEGIRSFVQSDVMAEAVDAKGATTHISVEASNTGELHDAERALNHAALMQRFTKRPCRAVIASRQNSEQLAKAIESGRIAWHQLKMRRA